MIGRLKGILVHKQPDDIWRIDYQVRDDEDTEALIGAGRQRSRGKAPVPGMGGGAAGRIPAQAANVPATDLADLIQQLTAQMHTAATELQFELAARLRDEIAEL